jgi:hypothetical protein
MLASISLLLALTTAPAMPAPAAPPTIADPVRDMGYVSASTLAQRCEDGSAAGISYCFAYITGIHDAMRAYEAWLNLREFCVPPTTPQADLKRHFLAYLTAHPETRTGQAASVVVVALREAYPCAAVTPARPTPEKIVPAAPVRRK